MRMEKKQHYCNQDLLLEYFVDMNSFLLQLLKLPQKGIGCGVLHVYKRNNTAEGCQY